MVNMNYIYYRAYSFYEKNKLAFNPHTYASVLPTLMQGFVIYLTYFLLVRFHVVLLLEGNLLVYVGVLLGLYYINDNFFFGKIAKYKKRWRSESLKVVKGVIIAILAVGSFVGILLIANGLHKLKSI